MLKYQAGAFPGSPIGPGCMCGFALYDLPNVDVVGYDVVSNRPKVAAYRAPGAPISSFAVESAIDELARKLKIDPLALREKNARAGRHQDALRRRPAPNIGYPRDAGSGARAIRTTRRRSARTRAAASPAGFWFNIGGESSAAVHINEDGTVSVVVRQPRHRRLARLDRR